VKKLTSERLGREGLAAWEERKSNADPEVAADAKDEDDTLDESEETKTEPEAAAGEEPSVADEEAQTQHGTNESRKFSRKSLGAAFFVNSKKWRTRDTSMRPLVCF